MQLAGQPGVQQGGQPGVQHGGQPRAPPPRPVMTVDWREELRKLDVRAKDALTANDAVAMVLVASDYHQIRLQLVGSHQTPEHVAAAVSRVAGLASLSGFGPSGVAS